jgi:hypothetical protein
VLVTNETFDTDMIVSATQAGAGVAGPLNGTKMGLFTNQPALTKTMLLAALTQPTYTGYALQALTWSAAERNAAGSISTHSALMNWMMGDALTPTTVYGYFICNTAGSVLLAAEYFPAPQALADTLSYFGVVSEWSANNQNAGQCTVVT